MYFSSSCFGRVVHLNLHLKMSRGEKKRKRLSLLLLKKKEETKMSGLNPIINGYITILIII